jgi:hypothetical protein
MVGRVNGITHHSISNGNIVALVLVFFGEDVRKVDFSLDMGDGGEVGLDGLPDGIVSHLDVAEPFCCHVLGPVYASHVVVVHFGRVTHHFLA